MQQLTVQERSAVTSLPLWGSSLRLRDTPNLQEHNTVSHDRLTPYNMYDVEVSYTHTDHCMVKLIPQTQSCVEALRKHFVRQLSTACLHSLAFLVH